MKITLLIPFTIARDYRHVLYLKCNLLENVGGRTRNGDHFESPFKSLLFPNFILYVTEFGRPTVVELKMGGP